MKWLWAVLAVVLLALAGCSGVPGGFGSGLPTPSRATHSATPARIPTLPRLRGATDGETQYLDDVVESHGTLVAAGGTHSSGVWRPLILISRDDGRTWRANAIAPTAGASVDDTISTLLVHRGTFYAYGTASGGAAAWTSADGRYWTRHAIGHDIVGPNDEFADVAANEHGFTAVGYRSAAGRFAVPETWTSPDGLRWTRHAGKPSGLSATNGDLQMYSVTAGVGGFVAVGEVIYSHGDRNSPRVWRSFDGATWSAVGLPDGFAGTGTRSWLEHVWWSGSGYVAVGTGGNGVRYAGVVATSRDGRAWSADDSGPGLNPSGQLYLDAGTTRSGHTIAIGDQCALDCRLYGVTDRQRRWQPVRLSGTTDGDAVGTGAAITTATGAVVLVGSVNPRHDRDARIWRSADGTAFDPAVIRAADRTQQALYVAGIGAGDHRYLAAGTSAGLPVVWSSTDGTHFAAPHALSHDTAFSASAIVHGPTGWLVLGSQAVGASEQAVAWTSSDGVHWQATAGGAFGRAHLYAYSALSSAVGWRGWVVVGAHATNGSSTQSALAARSANGRRWQAALSTRQTVPAGYRRTVRRYDLRGDVSGTRGMNGVAAVGAVLLAVGTAQTARGATVGEAAVWTSTDATRWSLALLPRGAARTASADHVAAAGNTVVAYGTTESDTTTTGVIWVSHDAGRTWRRHPLPGDAGADVHTDVLLATARGFVAGGSVGPSGAARPALWTSRTGLTWHRQPLTDRRLAAPGDWTLDGAVAKGGGIVGVATRVDARGSVPLVFTQQLP